jgi:hypothetical protein
MNYDGSLEAARTLGSWVIDWSDLMPDMIGKLDPQDELPRHAFTAANIILHLSTRKATLNELPVVSVRADSIAHISCILKELPTGILDIFTWLDFIMSKVTDPLITLDPPQIEERTGFVSRLLSIIKRRKHGKESSLIEAFLLAIL